MSAAGAAESHRVGAARLSEADAFGFGSTSSPKAAEV